jgi:hypothetical protein
MLVVPIKGDIITTEDGDEFTVAGFTNFRDKGPAVYVKSNPDSESKSTLPIYFFDIKNLNGIKVEFNNSSKVLNALGMLKRKLHLPQKDDYIIIEIDDDDKEEDTDTSTKKVKVKELKLHNKNIGLSRGLVILGDDAVIYSLESINRIKRSHGDSFFDKSQFLKLYKDYLGYNGKHK